MRRVVYCSAVPHSEYLEQMVHLFLSAGGVCVLCMAHW
jgi:hypothetical protein